MESTILKFNNFSVAIFGIFSSPTEMEETLKCLLICVLFLLEHVEAKLGSSSRRNKVMTTRKAGGMS
jgi:hypothetical protein